MRIQVPLDGTSVLVYAKYRIELLPRMCFFALWDTDGQHLLPRPETADSELPISSEAPMPEAAVSSHVPHAPPGLESPTNRLATGGSTGSAIGSTDHWLHQPDAAEGAHDAIQHPPSKGDVVEVSSGSEADSGHSDTESESSYTSSNATEDEPSPPAPALAPTLLLC